MRKTRWRKIDRRKWPADMVSAEHLVMFLYGREGGDADLGVQLEADLVAVLIDRWSKNRWRNPIKSDNETDLL